ncbi:MAG: sulfurase [Thalassolituus sp.]|jgi:uncharacterized protein YcbX|nr:MAG: sulfurase [Thalassolituus sp.]
MHISRLFIYPVKSCAGVEVDALHFDSSGPVGDRRFVITTPAGDFLTQRELPEMARIQPKLADTQLTLSHPDAKDCVVHFDTDGPTHRVRVWRDEILGVDCGDEVAAWLASRLGQEARLSVLPSDNPRLADPAYAEAGTQVGYADGFPLLVITQESLDKLSEDAGLDVDVRRFRPNIVVSGADGSFAEREWRRLGVGEGLQQQLPIKIVKPCERCVIPTRDPDTLERTGALMTSLKNLCRIDGRIIFGQNATYAGEYLAVGTPLFVSE